MATLAKNKSRPQKLFRNGGSQAVRIPKDMKFETDEVLLRRDGDRLIIEPKASTLKALSAQMGDAIEWDLAREGTKTSPENIF